MLIGLLLTVFVSRDEDVVKRNALFPTTTKIFFLYPLAGRHRSLFMVETLMHETNRQESKKFMKIARKLQRRLCVVWPPTTYCNLFAEHCESVAFGRSGFDDPNAIKPNSAILAFH